MPTWLRRILKVLFWLVVVYFVIGLLFASIVTIGNQGFSVLLTLEGIRGFGVLTILWPVGLLMGIVMGIAG